MIIILKGNIRNTLYIAYAIYFNYNKYQFRVSLKFIYYFIPNTIFFFEKKSMLSYTLL